MYSWFPLHFWRHKNFVTSAGTIMEPLHPMMVTSVRCVRIHEAHDAIYMVLLLRASHKKAQRSTNQYETILNYAVLYG